MRDETIKRWIGFLFILNFSLALCVVYGTHYSRVLQTKMETLANTEDKLHLSSKQLLIEKGAWLNLAVLQKEAESRLDMYLPEPKEVIFIYP